MSDAKDETPQAPEALGRPDERHRSVHDGSSGDIGLFDDLSQKSEKLLRYPNSPIQNADIGLGAELIAQTPENEGISPDTAPPEPLSQPEFQAAMTAQVVPPEMPGVAIPLVEPIRVRGSAPSSSGPLLIFFLTSFSICSAGLNVYLFWQARNLGAELQKRPPAPKPSAWQKR